ncbi:MAG: hypothetical protein K8I60_00645, partial [Anaerolineae bacterium]|nr:hypothetical protein [Anaerolineae bacterium]
MTGSRISLNIHAQNTPDRKYLLQHLQKLNPPAVLVMDAAGFAKEVKAALPNTIVIHRSWGTRGDDDIHKQLTPEQWVAQKIKEIDGGDLWCYTTNEPEFGDEVIRWHIEVMERAAKVGLKLVVGNWSVGKPDNVDNDWKRAQRMLELLDQNRKTMILGLHEYACGVVTSGFVGGPPSEFRDSKGNVLHPDFIKPENWPADTVKLGALWHCGRFKFLVQHCKNVGINPPRIIITEHGFDDVSDIKPWTETLKKTPTFGNQGGNIRGWKTLEGQWGDWFGRLNWTAQRAYFEQLKYADQHIYQGSVVEAQLIFSWGHSADIWAQFDVADSRELHGLLEGYAKDPS